MPDTSDVTFNPPWTVSTLDAVPVAAPPTEAPRKVKTELYGTHCCAMQEIDNLSASSSPEEALKTLRSQLDWWLKSFIIFTAVVKFSETKLAHRALGSTTAGTTGPHPVFNDSAYGQALADFIVEKGLGTVIASEPRLNVGSGNMVKVWIWQTDKDGINRYFNSPAPAQDPNQPVV